MLKKRLDIQGLRSLAILGVLGFHIWPKVVPGGYLGVDMFFSLSGYLMATLLNKSERISRSVTFDFYFRRARRIIPVYLFILFTSLLVAFLTLLRFDYTKILEDLAPALYYWSNMAVLFKTENYFKQLSNTNFFLHTWSLAVEIQFYLCVPLIFTILKLSNRYSYKLLIVKLILSKSLILYFYLTPNWSFEFLGCRIWQFMMGIFAFYMGQIFSFKDSTHDKEPLLKESSNEGSKFKLLLNLISYLSILLLLIVFIVKFKERVVNVFVIFITSLLLYLGSINESNRLLSNSIMIWIGDNSYVIYLVHWPIIQVYRYFSVEMEFILLDGIFILILSFGLSALIHEYVEKPLLKIGNLRDLMKTICFLYFAIMMLYFVVDYRKEPEFLSHTENYNKVLIHLGTNNTRQVAIDMLSTEMKAQLNRVKTGIPCTIGNKTYHDKVDLDPRKIRWECDFKGDGNLKVLLIGNSHAHSSGLAWDLALSGKYKRLYFFMTTGCLTFTGINSGICKNFSNIATELVKDFKPDVLIVTSRYGNLNWPPFRNIITDKYFKSMNKFFKTVQPWVSQKIFLNRPMIEFPHETGPLEASKRLLLGMNLTSMGMEEEKYWRMFESVNLRLNNLQCEKCHFIEYTPFFCSNKFCRPYDPETELFYFRDNHHLNSYGNWRISEYFRSKYVKLIKT